MTSVSRSGAWPALMSLECVCSYLSLDSFKFQQFAQRYALRPVELDSEVILWRRTDIDQLLKRLPSTDILPSASASSTVRLSQATIDQIALAVVARLNAGGADLPTSRAKLLSIRDAATQLGVGRSTVFRLIERGALSITKIGRRTLISQGSIDAVVEGMATDG